MDMPCRLCMAFEQDGDMLRAQLLSYIDSLDPEQKADDALYRQRLAQCEVCEAMHQGLCKYCGCFAIVRAVKKQLSCPKPGRAMW